MPLSSSRLIASETSAFKPYSRYANKSMCIVPREWKSYSHQTMDIALQRNLTSHWNAYKKVEGAVVQIGDVAAKLEYHDQRLWMKRCGDLRNNPDRYEYVLTYIEKFDPQN